MMAITRPETNPSFDKISDFLDVENNTQNSVPMVIEHDYPTAEPKETSKNENLNLDEKIEADFEMARENIVDAIKNANTALEEVIHLGRATESARPYEVADSLLKNIVDANFRLMELHEKKEKIKKALTVKKEEPQIQEGTTVTNIQNNIVFSGTTADLDDLIERQIKLNNTKTIEQ